MSNKEYTVLDVLGILREDSNRVFFSNGKKFTGETIRNMTYSDLEDCEPFMEKLKIPESDIEIISKIGELIELWSNRKCVVLYTECDCFPFQVKCDDGDMCDLIYGLRVYYDDVLRELL